MRSALARLKRVDHQQQFHQAVIDRRACGLNDKNVRAAHIFLNLQVGFAVREGPDHGGTERAAQAIANLLGERRIRCSGEYLEVVIHCSCKTWGRHR